VRVSMCVLHINFNAFFSYIYIMPFLFNKSAFSDASVTCNFSLQYFFVRHLTMLIVIRILLHKICYTHTHIYICIYIYIYIYI
jgi:hypothetical protein